MRILRRLLDGIGVTFLKAGRRFYTYPMEERLDVWQRDPQYTERRFDYPLDQNSLVLDLGGYEGQWASDIYSRYCCTIHVFEPVEDYAASIQRRFAKNQNIVVHPFGFGAADTTIQIGLGADRSSVFHMSAQTCTGRIVKAEDFLKAQGIAHIDLMKINIEGGEYELLEHLLDTGLVAQIENIQVQFHDFIPNAEARMHSIQEKLRQSHALTYQVEFIWENWKLQQ